MARPLGTLGIRQVYTALPYQQQPTVGQAFSVYNRADRIALAGVSGLANGGLLLVGQGGVHLADPQGADQEVRP